MQNKPVVVGYIMFFSILNIADWCRQLLHALIDNNGDITYLLTYLVTYLFACILTQSFVKMDLNRLHVYINLTVRS